MAFPPNTQLIPFLAPNSNAFRALLMVNARGKEYTYEDVTWNVWEGILPLYFPANVGGPTYWLVAHEAYRGPPGLPRPDFVVLQCWRLTPRPTLLRGPPGSQPQLALPQRGRDYLWVECKAPSHDTAAGWWELLDQTGAKLARAHPNRAVAVIAAVGHKCLWFLWDPAHSLQPRGNRQRLHLPDKKEYQLRPEFEVFDGNTNYWHHSGSGAIFSADAISLLPWDNHPSILHGMQQLDAFLRWVACQPWVRYGGYNPREWQC